MDIQAVFQKGQNQDLFDCLLKKAESTDVSEPQNCEQNPQEKNAYDKMPEKNQFRQKTWNFLISQNDQSFINSEEDPILCQIEQIDQVQKNENNLFINQMQKTTVRELNEDTDQSLNNEEEDLSPSDYQIFQRLKNKILNTSPSKKMYKRNKNMPTFLTRMFLNYHSQYKKYYQKFPLIYNRIPKNPADLNKCFGRTKAFNINHLLKLINGQLDDYEYSKINRKVFKLILRNHLYDEVIANGQCKLKKTYLNMSKVFSLRCISSKLIQRMKSK